MVWDDVVVIALGLPGIVVSISYGTPALKVSGKLLTGYLPDVDSLVLLSVPPDERAMLMDVAPDVFHLAAHYVPYPAVLARLSPLAPEQLTAFLERRWRDVAPKRLRASLPVRPPAR